MEYIFVTLVIIIICLFFYFKSLKKRKVEEKFYIELKQKCFSNFINLTYINYHLLEKLNVMKTSSVLYLTSCGKKSRVERVLIHHGLHDLFNDIICNEKKFEIIVNKTQDINKILVFDDDKIQLDMAHVAGIKKENLFLVRKENIYGFEKICF